MAPHYILSDAHRQMGDALADTFIAQTFAQNPAPFYEALKAEDDSLSLLVKQIAPELYNQTHTLPEWANRRQIQEAERLFTTRAGEVMLLLGLYALPYCYAAAPGAKVLAATERLSKHGAFQRLSETGRFVWDVLSGDAETAANAILKVRLIHALVRHHLTAQAWPLAELGLPANQEDMAGTLLAFGYLTIRGLRKLGLPLSTIEAEAWLHTWNVVGYRLGTSLELLPQTQADAFALEQAIAKRNFRPSDEGRQLTQNLIATFGQSQAPAWVKDHAASWMAQLLGPEVAEILGLPNNAASGGFATLRTFNQWRALVPLPIDWLGTNRMRRESQRYRLSI